MNSKSLKRIEEVISNSGKLDSLEISQDLIYLEFGNVELGYPKGDVDFTLAIRFAEESFISVFYNNIWDIEFFAGYDFRNQVLSKRLNEDIKKIKFIDFEYLNNFFHDYKKEKTFSVVEDFDIHNIRSDFFVLFETSNIAFVVGGNQMNFFSPYERLDDNSLKELSNEWMLYFLKYHLKRNLIKDPMCENHPWSPKK